MSASSKSYSFILEVFSCTSQNPCLRFGDLSKYESLPTKLITNNRYSIFVIGGSQGLVEAKDQQNTFYVTCLAF